MTQTRFDFIATFVVIATGVLFLVLAMQIETSGRRTAAEALVGPPMVPIIISSGIIILGMLELLVLFRAQRKTKAPDLPPSNDEFAPLTWGLAARVFLTAAIGLMYVWLLSATGYLIATVCTLAALLMLFGTRSPVKILLISVIGAAVYYYFFIRLMGVYDPPGWLINLG